MKSIIKYIIGGMGLLSITSCSDFLDQSSPSEIKATWFSTRLLLQNKV